MCEVVNHSKNISGRPLSAIHRDLHKGSIDAARRLRYDGATHARLLQLAGASRAYVQRLKQLES